MARLAILAGRSVHIGATWYLVLQQLIADGHVIVATVQPLPDALSNDPRDEPEIFPRDITTSYFWSIPVQEQALVSMENYLSGDIYPQTHLILIGMMSRRDSTGTFRNLDREVVLRRLHLSIFSQLLRSRPTHVIFAETPHEVVHFALMRIAEWMNIPVLFFQTSLLGPQMIARTGIDQILKAAAPLVGPTNYAADRLAIQKISLSTIARLRDGGGTALVARQQTMDNKSRTISQSLRAMFIEAKRIVNPPSASLTFFTGHHYIRGRFREAAGRYLEWSLRRSLTSEIGKLPPHRYREGERYALFALHYEPERTSMPEGLPVLSQLDAIVAARVLLPIEIPLIVKEHYAQQSSALRGHVGRSPLFYELLSSIPGVQVVGLKSDARALAREAECVFTLTGKIAIEAVFLGKPAVYFGQPWWVDLPGAISYNKINQWSDIGNVPLPSPETLYAWFEKKISQSLLVGLGETSPEKYSVRNARLPQNFEKLEVESLISAIREFLTA